MRVDFQVHVDLGAVVELANPFGIALFAVILGIDFVIDGRGEGGKTVRTVFADDVSFHGSSSCVGDIDDGVGYGIVLLVENFSKKQASGGFLFLICQRRARDQSDRDKHQG